MTEIFKQGPIELRLGKWQDVLADVVECDAVIGDPPFSARTHAGRRTGSEIRQSSIGYDSIDRNGAGEIVRFWASRVHRWVVLFGDHVTAGWYREVMCERGLYVFQPIPWCKTDPAPRMSGDGPASAVEHISTSSTDDEMRIILNAPPGDWISVARARSKEAMLGSVKGYYEGPTSSTRGAGGKKGFPGAKPLWLMRAIIRDYTRPGDLVVDPCAGGATTLIAAAIEGRRAIGAECDPETFAKAVIRIKAGYTPDLFSHGLIE